MKYLDLQSWQNKTIKILYRELGNPPFPDNQNEVQKFYKIQCSMHGAKNSTVTYRSLIFSLW